MAAKRKLKFILLAGIVAVTALSLKLVFDCVRKEETEFSTKHHC